MSDCNHTTLESCLRADECAECLREGAKASFAAPTGLAARVVVNQALVDEIVRRAKESEFGLGDPIKNPDISIYEPHDIDMLAVCLVSSWEEKYDLVSVFAAAMRVMKEKAANAGTQRPGTPDGSLATETRKPGSLK